ncbi:hypothetical protein J2Z23_004094 [Lederbergia galactosidilyticus]|uniref:hypothetical protein n=1 Tax=Lederbergia galactosidilytica TaxID=217031 RepID=UPI001AE1F691|nr:hypothetical protein [Lederbergia galactosidilytica]MBP1917109.1 hypothetical protein [Lederbergia galactosidilytica]
MRDPKRMKKILDFINELWEQQPDMRFFQLIDSLEHEYSNKNNGFGYRKGYEVNSRKDKQPMAFVDLFYLEDDDFLGFLRDLIEKK